MYLIKCGVCGFGSEIAWRRDVKGRLETRLKKKIVSTNKVTKTRGTRKDKLEEKKDVGSIIDQDSRPFGPQREK